MTSRTVGLGLIASPSIDLGFAVSSFAGSSERRAEEIAQRAWTHCATDLDDGDQRDEDQQEEEQHRKHLRQALSVLQSREFDGMILDIGIGQIDGLEVLRRVRMTNQRLPILMITASGSQELAMKAIGLGAQAYVLKPFDTHQLQQMMDRWFGPV